MANNNRKRGVWGFAPTSLTGPGTLFTFAFISLAVGMAVLLSRGFTPSSTLTEPEDKDTQVELVVETPVPGQKGLQIKTLKFKECGSTVTIDLLLDRSGSMGNQTPSGKTKMERLKEAVNELVANIQDSSVIGVQSFDSSPASEVPVSYYKDVKTTVSQRIAALQPRGGTATSDALKFSLNILKEALPKYPGRNFNFILISDGIPTSGQDPRQASPNPADEIKKLGVTVWTLGIYSANENNVGLGDVLKNVASSPSHYYAATTADDTKKLLSQINSKICNDGATPSPTQ